MSAAVKVFAGLGKEFIRFSAVPSKTDGNNPTYTMVFHGGQKEGYVIYDSDLNLSEMLFELTGFDSKLEVHQIEFIISPLALLVFLGACDVILQGRYEGGWFTASAVQNAFDLAGDSGFDRICAPIAYLASDAICHSLSEDDINGVLREMAEDEIFETDELDDIPFYSFTPELRYIPTIFENISNRLAVLKEAGDETTIHYIITNSTGTWGFTAAKDTGRIERLTLLKLQELCKFISAG